MKRIGLLSAVYFFCILTMFAQVPQGFSFQGVAFDESGDPLNESEITVRIEIIDEDISGTSIYSELHEIVTSIQGLYSLSVGMGDVESGQFEDINWLENLKFIKVSIDDTGDGVFEVIGTNQFLSVPYALAAGSAPTSQNIFVRLPLFKSKMIAKNGIDYDGQGSIKYIYQWIDGINEDVYIEITGLPDNMALYTNARGGFGLSQVVKNTSHIDTILDGILKPSSFIGLDDKNIEVPPGVYPLNLTFKTESKVFKTITDTLFINGVSYEDCFNELPSAYTLDSISCPEFEYLFNNEIVISEGNLIQVIMSPFMIAEGENSLTFPQGEGCDNYTYNINLAPVVDFTYFVTLLSFEFVGNELIFEVEFENFVTNEITNCIFIYQQ